MNDLEKHWMIGRLCLKFYFILAKNIYLNLLGCKWELSMKMILWFTGEILILTVGLYYGNSARNARVQFEERRFLFYAITAELTFSSIYNTIRTVYPIPFHQDVTFIAAFFRSLLTNTLALIIIFAPKVWSIIIYIILLSILNFG